MNSKMNDWQPNFIKKYNYFTFKFVNYVKAMLLSNYDNEWISEDVLWLKKFIKSRFKWVEWLIFTKYQTPLEPSYLRRFAEIIQSLWKYLFGWR